MDMEVTDKKLNEPEMSSGKALKKLIAKLESEKLTEYPNKELVLCLKNDDGIWKAFSEVLKTYIEQFNKLS